MKRVDFLYTNMHYRRLGATIRSAVGANAHIGPLRFWDDVGIVPYECINGAVHPIGLL